LSINPANPEQYPPRLLFRESISDYAIRDSLLRHSGFVRGNVLDLGCGHKPYSGVFAGQVKSWLGVDWPNPVHGGEPDVVADVLSLPLMESAFDTVICTQVLEHVSEPLCLFEEARRVLRPGGMLLLTAPQYNAVHEEPRDFFRYTRYGLEHLARKAGLVVEFTEPIGGFVSLFAFITSLHFAPLRISGVSGLWQWAAWRLEKRLYRPKDCIGYVLAATKAEKPAE